MRCKVLVCVVLLKLIKPGEYVSLYTHWPNPEQLKQTGIDLKSLQCLWRDNAEHLFVLIGSDWEGKSRCSTCPDLCVCEHFKCVKTVPSEIKLSWQWLLNNLVFWIRKKCLKDALHNQGHHFKWAILGMGVYVLITLKYFAFYQKTSQFPHQLIIQNVFNLANECCFIDCYHIEGTNTYVIIKVFVASLLYLRTFVSKI